MWVAAAGGGIFRTPDALAASVSWTPSSAGMASNAIGSLISIPPTRVATRCTPVPGEPNGSSDSEAGVGLYKSTDGGVSWSSCPAARRSRTTARSRRSRSIRETRTTSSSAPALARHGSSSSNGGRRTPPDAPTLGVYETTDGGASFTLAFSKPGDPTPPDTGADFFTGGVNKIELDPNDPRVVYAAVLGYGIWRRDAATTTFAQVFATLYPADSVEADAPGDTFGDRTEFDLADLGAKTRMYVGDSSDDNLYSALWRTDDAGQAAANLVSAPTATANAANRTPRTSCSRIPTLPTRTASRRTSSVTRSAATTSSSSPTRATPTRVSRRIDELRRDLRRDGCHARAHERTRGRAFDDAGESFTDMTNENRPTILDDPSTPPDQRAQGMHPDQHALVFSPANGAGSERVFIGSDGGVVRTSGAFANDSARCDSRQEANPDDAKFTSAELALCHQALRAVPTGIESLNAGLSTLQFQSLSLSPASPAGDVLGGTQDNGTWAFTGDPAGWFESIGGDGGQSAIDPTAGTRVHTYFGPTTDVNFHGNDPNTWDYISQPLDEANALCGTVDPHGECFRSTSR